MDESKTRDERIAELLAGSAHDAVKAIKGPSLSDVVTNEEKPVEEVVTDEDEGSKGDKKIRIRASRLKTLEDETEEFKSRVAALEEQIAQSKKDEETLPDWWVEAYGDNEVSRKGYANQQRIFREELNRQFDAREQQRAAEETAQEERIQSIEQSFDEQMESLEESLGRDLTASQKSELLDIVGEYSPTDEEGRYIAYMPVEKAYELWSKDNGKNEAKKEMAAIAGMSSSGSSSTQSSERPQWGDWRKRYGA